MPAQAASPAPAPASSKQHKTPQAESATSIHGGGEVVVRLPIRDDGKIKYPNLQNATVTWLVDEVGDARRAKGLIESLDKYLSVGLKARLEEGQTIAKGDKWEMSLNTVSATRLKTDPTKELLQKLLREGSITDDEYSSCFDTLTYDTMRFNRL